MESDRFANVSKGFVACSPLADATRKTGYLSDDKTVFTGI
jgi:hypothetical protein